MDNKFSIAKNAGITKEAVEAMKTWIHLASIEIPKMTPQKRSYPHRHNSVISSPSYSMKEMYDGYHTHYIGAPPESQERTFVVTTPYTVNFPTLPITFAEAFNIPPEQTPEEELSNASLEDQWLVYMKYPELKRKLSLIGRFRQWLRENFDAAGDFPLS